LDLSELPAGFDESIARHPWEVSRRQFAANLVAEIAERKKGRLRRIVDIGCGDAYVSRQLAVEHPHVRVDAIDTAFTPDLLARLAAVQQLPNLHLLPAIEALDDTAFSDTASSTASAEPISLVLLMDVLEHVPDDRALLGSIAGNPHLAADAWFLITVPALASLYCSHDRLLGHYRRYRYEQLRQLAIAVDLVPVEGGYCYLSGVVVRGLRVLMEKTGLAKPLVSTEVSRWQGGPLRTRLVLAALAFDLQLSRWFARLHLPVPGLSCFLICRKPGS
jgi:trans-aconitate methyltransferase